MLSSSANAHVKALQPSMTFQKLSCRQKQMPWQQRGHQHSSQGNDSSQSNETKTVLCKLQEAAHCMS